MDTKHFWGQSECSYEIVTVVKRNQNWGPFMEKASEAEILWINECLASRGYFLLGCLSVPQCFDCCIHFHFKIRVLLLLVRLYSKVRLTNAVPDWYITASGNWKMLPVSNISMCLTQIVLFFCKMTISRIRMSAKSWWSSVFIEWRNENLWTLS